MGGAKRLENIRDNVSTLSLKRWDLLCGMELDSAAEPNPDGPCIIKTGLFNKLYNSGISFYPHAVRRDGEIKGRKSTEDLLNYSLLSELNVNGTTYIFDEQGNMTKRET